MLRQSRNKQALRNRQDNEPSADVPGYGKEPVLPLQRSLIPHHRTPCVYYGA